MPDPIRSFLRRETNDVAGPDLNAAQESMMATLPAKDQRHLAPPDRSMAGRNYQGLPIKEDEEPPWHQLVGDAFRRDADQKIAYWQGIYGKGKVRVADTGQILVTVKNDEGKEHEIPTNSQAYHAKDILKVLGVIPEMASSFAGTKGARAIPTLGKAMGPIGWTRDLIAGSLAAEAGGALKDVGMRMKDDLDVPVGDILQDRAGMAVGDMFIGGAIGLTTTLGMRAVTPLMGQRPPIQVDRAAGAKLLKDRFGIDIDYTAGQMSGLKGLQRLEGQLMALPGGGSGAQKIAASQSSAFKALANKLVGLPAEATDLERIAFMADDVGSDAIAMLRGSTEPKEIAVRGAREQAAMKANAGLEQMMAKSTLNTRRLLPSAMGDAIRTRLKTAWDEFEEGNKVRYGATYKLPGGSDRALVTPGLATRASELIKKLPPNTEIIEKLDFDNYGNPISRTETVKGQSKEFIPANVVGRLRELAGSAHEARSLEDLVAMRTDVMDSINTAAAFGDTQSKWLYKIRGLLNEAIDEGTDALPDGQLKRTWKLANDKYAQGMERFDTPTSKQILRDPDQGGMGPAAMANRAVTDADFYNGLKSLLGANSPEYLSLKRHVADRLYDDSLLTGGKLLDANKFIARLDEFYKSRPDIAEDLYGPKSGNRAAKLYLGAGALKYIQDPKFDVGEVEAFLAGKSQYKSLRDLVDAQRDLDRAYKNKVLKAVGSNTIPADGIEPDELVNRVLNTANAKDAKAIMGLISQDANLLARVRAKAMQSVLDEAERNPTSADRATRLLDPVRSIATGKLDDILKDRKRNLVEVLGQESVENLEAYGKAIKPIEVGQSDYAGAGSMSSGMVNRSAIMQAERGGLKGLADTILRNYIVSLELTSPGFRKWLSKEPISPATRLGVTTTIMTSAPALQALMTDFGPKGVLFAADKFKELMDGPVDAAFQRQQNAATNTTTVPTGNSRDEIRQWLRRQAP